MIGEAGEEHVDDKGVDAGVIGIGSLRLHEGVVTWFEAVFGVTAGGVFVLEEDEAFACRFRDLAIVKFE